MDDHGHAVYINALDVNLCGRRNWQETSRKAMKQPDTERPQQTARYNELLVVMMECRERPRDKLRRYTSEQRGSSC